jgi:Zn-dependent protease with chaperone function
MKFVPRPLDPEAADASRGHDRHPLRELALLITGVAVICGVLYLLAVLIADAVVSRIAPATEARLFAAFSHSLSEPASLTSEQERTKARAERLLPRLMEKADLAGLPVRLQIWDSPQTNAFALPGGTIVLTRGLLECLDEDISMAFVLAHELGHFHGRDHLRGLGRQISFQVVRALVFSGQSEVRLGADQTAQLAFLAYSRDRESLADRYALRLVHDTLGSNEGATRLFELLRGDRLPGWAYMFNSHPDVQNRIESMRGYSGELDRRPGGTNRAQ